MYDYVECSVIAERLRFLADDLEIAYGAEEGESLFAEAADAIEELLKEVQSRENDCINLTGECATYYAQIPKWISVDERLPETDSVVLCFCRAHLVEMLMFAEDCWIGAGGLWSKTEYMKDYVTYWMPLPEPPKEVDEDG